jgi:leucine dehydrogenase
MLFLFMDPNLEILSVPGYEEVYKISHLPTGLLGVIAVHSTLRGPSLGGVRICAYKNFESALNDALRLSKGMTYKAAISDAELGGGKAVIIADPNGPISTDLLHAYAECVNRLEGRYYTAEDSGITPLQLLRVAEKTPYIVGLEREGSSGNPCPFTAWGVLRAIEATLFEIYGSPLIEGKTIAIQGLGAVGMRIAEILFWHGAHLIVTDVREEKIFEAVDRFKAKAVDKDEILSIPCDILSPSAYGGILNQKTIPALQCRAIVGCANNQLLEKTDGLLLKERGILYAPDYVVNAGGVINVQFELRKEGYSPAKARDEVRKIYTRLQNVYSLAKKENISTDEAAFLIAEEKIYSHV